MTSKGTCCLGKELGGPGTAVSDDDAVREINEDGDMDHFLGGRFRPSGGDGVVDAPARDRIDVERNLLRELEQSRPAAAQLCPGCAQSLLSMSRIIFQEPSG